MQLFVEFSLNFKKKWFILGLLARPLEHYILGFPLFCRCFKFLGSKGEGIGLNVTLLGYF